MHQTMPEVSPEEAQAIAAEAFIYAYAMLYGYKALFAQAVDPAANGYVGGFDRYRHFSRTTTPQDRDIVTPNNDTPYSWAWLDLRSEPIVLSVPEMPEDRYYVCQFFDLYTHNFAYVGSRATGNGAGNYLFAAPTWDGAVPGGVSDVFRSETDIIGTLTRTEIKPDEVEEPARLTAVQRQLRFLPLSEFAASRPPFPAPTYIFPAWDDAKANSPDFIQYLNFLLQFCPPVESETELMARFSQIGIGSGLPFDASTFDPEYRQALADGVADGTAEIEAENARVESSADYFGTREFLGEDYTLKRAVAADLGLFGNSQEEALYRPYQTDANGNPLLGGERYELRFAPDQIPPVRFFWSMTMYDLPARQLVENPIDRYSIGGRTEGLKTEADGSIVIYIQPEAPGPDKEGNWLPSPSSGEFYMNLRMYGPEGSLVDGAWTAPEAELVS